MRNLSINEIRSLIDQLEELVEAAKDPENGGSFYSVGELGFILEEDGTIGIISMNE